MVRCTPSALNREREFGVNDRFQSAMRRFGHRVEARRNSVLNMRARAGRSRAGRVPNSMFTHSTGRLPADLITESMRVRVSTAVRRPMRSLVPRATITADARVLRTFVVTIAAP